MSNQPKCGIFVGATEETVKQANDAVMNVVESSAGDSIKLKALETLSRICTVENVHISDNTVYIDDAPKPVQTDNPAPKPYGPGSLPDFDYKLLGGR